MLDTKYQPQSFRDAEPVRFTKIKRHGEIEGRKAEIVKNLIIGSMISSVG